MKQTVGFTPFKGFTVFTVILGILTLNLGFVSAAQAGCTRHIYNKSKNTHWRVSIDFFARYKIPCRTGPESCTDYKWYDVDLPPGKSLVFHTHGLNTSWMMRNGEHQAPTIRLFKWSGPTATYDYIVDRGIGDYHSDYGCFGWEHSGRTPGNHALNTPTNGDVTLLD